MTPVTILTKSGWRMLTVTEIRPAMDGVWVCFSSDQMGFLSAADEDYPWALQWLSMCREDGGPTGVLLSSDNHILSTGMVERTQVMDIEVCRRAPDLVDVWMGGRPGPLALITTQPNYHTLLTCLVEAQEKCLWIWCFCEGSTIVEVVPDEDQNDSPAPYLPQADAVTGRPLPTL